MSDEIAGYLQNFLVSLRPRHVFDGNLRIHSVLIGEIDCLDAEALERAFDGLFEVFGPSRSGSDQADVCAMRSERPVERNVRTRGVRGVIQLEQRIDADGAREVFGRSLSGRLRAVLCDGNRARKRL